MRWRTVKNRFAEEGKLPFALKPEPLAKARWGWLADKRLADINDARKELAERLKEIEETRRNDLAFAVDANSPKGLAIRALRLEEFGDRERAGKEWSSFAAQTESELDKRKWYLLASQQKAKASIGKLPDDATTRRVKLIEDYLKRADSIKASIRPGDPDENKKRKDVRVMCREVIDLYENETGQSANR